MGKVIELNVFDKDEIQKKCDESFQEYQDQLECQHDMNRVSREKLIQLGVEDDRSELDKRLDKKETEKFMEYANELFTYIENHPTN